MAVPTFHILDVFEPRPRDLIILPYSNGEEGIFPKEILDEVPVSPVAPISAGGRRVLYVGQKGEDTILVVAVRLDAEHVSQEEALMKAVANHLAEAGEEFGRVVVALDKEWAGLAPAVLEGALLGGYRFDKYLSEKKTLPEAAVFVPGGLPKDVKNRLKDEASVLEWVNLARDILNEPPEAIHPVSLAEIMKGEGKKAGLKITVWDEKRLAKEGCGGILAVGKGSIHPPRLVIGRYKGRRPRLKVALVGKGVTFDTGGYCLKPSSALEGMKYDMSGAAAVFAAGCALAGSKLPLDLAIYAPLAENAISHRAYKTSDIVTTRCGKTVQVDNTDAEGRLILADALCLASEEKPDLIVDCATLTGACVVALGEDVAGLFTDDDELAQAIMEAGERAHERFWRLPLHRPYREQLKAEIADMKNIGGKWGGAVTAALFLSEFVGQDLKWAHLDIAGPAVKEEPLGHLGKGAKGFGVKTLVALCKEIAAKR